MQKYLLFLLFLSISLLGFDVGNGKTLVLSLSSCEGNVTLDERTFPVTPDPSDPQKGMALISFDYHTPLGKKEAYWNTKTCRVAMDIEVVSSLFSSEILSVDPSKVTPPDEVLAQIAEEKAEAEAIYARYTPHRYWNKPFIRPIDSITTSAYGTSRTYNETLKSYHGGVDFRALTPLPIAASNNGVVVLAKERYYAGGSVVLDHGEGLYSTYYHLSRIDVKPGQFIQQGESVGLSGATGRITGPHLHFGMMVHTLQSDPLDLIEQINGLYKGKQ